MKSGPLPVRLHATASLAQTGSNRRLANSPTNHGARKLMREASPRVLGVALATCGLLAILLCAHSSLPLALFGGLLPRPQPDVQPPIGDRDGSAMSRLVLHVDCDKGSDAGHGSAKFPFLSPRAARDALRALRPLKRPADVLIRGDCLPRSGGVGVDFSVPLLELTDEDSGTAAAPITYKSYPSEREARFVSGVKIPPSAWQQKTGTEVLRLNLTRLGVPKSFFGGFQRPSLTDGAGLGQCLSHRMELFVGGQAMTLARYPNLESTAARGPGHATAGASSWMRIARVLDAQSDFITDDPRAANWADEPDGWLHGYWGFDWADSHVPIRSVTPVKPGGNSTQERARIQASKASVGRAHPSTSCVTLKCQ
jgi:hypothetical protein